MYYFKFKVLTSEASSGGTYSHGWYMYNNMVKFMNDSMNTVYGNPAYSGLRCRALNVEDIQEVYPGWKDNLVVTDPLVDIR